jgi:hypothetical protein
MAHALGMWIADHPFLDDRNEEVRSHSAQALKEYVRNIKSVAIIGNITRRIGFENGNSILFDNGGFFLTP